MGLATGLGNLMKGLATALLRAGVLTEVLSSAIRNGIEGGITKATPSVLRLFALGALFATGIFLFGQGLAQWLTPLFTTPGIGFMLAGIVFVSAGTVYFVSTNQ